MRFVKILFQKLNNISNLAFLTKFIFLFKKNKQTIYRTTNIKILIQETTLYTVNPTVLIK